MKKITTKDINKAISDCRFNPAKDQSMIVMVDIDDDNYLLHRIKEISNEIAMLAYRKDTKDAVPLLDKLIKTAVLAKARLN